MNNEVTVMGDEIRKLKIQHLYLILILLPIGLLGIADLNSFNYTWKGRAYYLFFIWLFLLEAFLNKEKIKVKFEVFSTKRKVLTIFLMVLPTLFIVYFHFLGFKHVLTELGIQLQVPLVGSWPLSIEYVCLSILFFLSTMILYGKDLTNFLVSHSFLFLIGLIYLVDTLYPYGSFTLFQALVPFTTSFAAQILNLMGYQTSVINQSMGTPVLALFKNNKLICLYGIGWPCAGVQGLLIYTFILIFFIKDLPLSFKEKAIIYSVGAVGAYTVNAFRIVLIYLITIDQGKAAAKTFHDVYGGLLSMSWIVLYLVIITMLSRRLYSQNLMAKG